MAPGVAGARRRPAAGADLRHRSALFGLGDTGRPDPDAAAIPAADPDAGDTGVAEAGPDVAGGGRPRIHRGVGRLLLGIVQEDGRMTRGPGTTYRTAAL